MHINTICFITRYYSLTCFDHLMHGYETYKVYFTVLSTTF